jgi:ferritin-like metal-binding protein YciE
MARHYSWENQLIKALPKRANDAHYAALKGCFNDHLMETKNRVGDFGASANILPVPAL